MRIPQRRARHSLLIGLGTYAVLQGSLLWLLAVKQPWLRASSYADRVHGLRMRMQETPARPLTAVMFGSSRTVMGLQATLLDEPLSAAAARPAVAYNFGFWGAGPF